MRVLAIGATGFIGSYVLRLLVEHGHQVAVLHRGVTSGELSSDVQPIHGSRDAIGDVLTEVRQFRPEVVLDVIPYTRQQAQELVETFRGLAQRVVAVSSADVYRNYEGFCGKATAPPDPVPLSEDAPLRKQRYPYRGYGLPFHWANDYDKILVEQVVLDDPDLPGTVLRLPAVFGPGDRQHRLRTYLRRMIDGRPAVLMSEEQARWRWTRSYVENVATAIALAIENGRAAGRIYNVGEETAITEREWVLQIGLSAGWSGDVRTVPAEHLPEHLRQPFDFHYDLWTETSQIRRELAYVEPVGQQEALKRTVEWELIQPDESDSPDYSAEDAILAAKNESVQ